MAVIAKFRYGTTDVLTFGFGGGLWNTVSWVPRVSAAGEDVEETITVLLETATDDVMATQIQYIDDLILRVDRYRTNPAYETPVWLHAKRNDETGERRAVVKRMSYVLLNSEFDCEAMQHQTQYQFTITRGGYWERTTARTFPDDPIAVANILHSYDYTATADIVGDVPARVELLVYGLTDVDRAWFGIRSAAVRQIASFEGTWELEDGTNTGLSADDAATEPNAASPGGGAGVFVTGTPTASDTWERYMSISLNDVYAAPADYDAALGTFLWLLRAKVGAASNTYQVQLRFGYEGMDDADYIRGPIVEVSNTDWDLYEMGVQTWPLRDLRGITSTMMAYTYEGTLTIQVWAKRTEGASTIKLDCLCPLAVDEGYLIVRDTATGSDMNPGGRGAGESPLGHWCAVTYATIGPVQSLVNFGAVDARNFGLPPGDGRMDCVFAKADESVLELAASIGTTGTYLERWRSLRGNE